MKILVLAPTIIGGIDYQPSPTPQDAPEHIARHLVEIGNATPYEAKVVEVTEKKSLSASQPAPVLPEKTAPKRRGRPRKQSS